MAEAVQKRFEKYVTRTEGCWVWGGSKTPAGYGVLHDGEKLRYAHRLSYSWNNGPIPAGHYVCHDCDNPGCVNPAHLFCGKPLDNVRDCKKKGRHACGTRKSNAKLTDIRVRKIRRLAREGKKQVDLAHMFRVDASVISEVISRKRWQHVT